MNRSLGLIFLMSLILASPGVPGARAESPAPEKAPPTVKEFASVEKFLSLSDAELEQLQQAIARIRALSPAERAALRQEIAHYRSLPAEQQHRMRQGWSTPEQPGQWKEMMQHLPAARRQEIQAKLQSLPHKEKAAYRQQVLEEYARSKSPAN